MSNFTTLKGPDDALPASMYASCGKKSLGKVHFTTTRESLEASYHLWFCPNCDKPVGWDLSEVNRSIADLARRSKEIDEDD